MKDPDPGFYKISDAEYHDGPGISRSGLVKLLRSPAHYRTPTPESPTLQFGKWFHLAALETDRFETELIVKPEGMKFSTKEGKAWRAEAEASGKEIISYEDWVTIQEMCMAIRRSNTARELLCDGDAELSGYWHDPQYPDILCKMRMDWINKPKRTIVDLKKVTDAREHPFKALAYKLGYHMEAAWYCYGATQITGVEHNDFRFICVEADPPYGVQVYKADEEMLGEGLRDCSKALEVYKECVHKDAWPCYPDELKDLSLPGWVRRTQDSVIHEGGF